MSHHEPTLRSLAVVASLALLAVGCQGGAEETGEAASDASASSPVSEVPVSLPSGDVLVCSSGEVGNIETDNSPSSFAYEDTEDALAALWDVELSAIGERSDFNEEAAAADSYHYINEAGNLTLVVQLATSPEGLWGLREANFCAEPLG